MRMSPTGSDTSTLGHQMVALFGGGCETSWIWSLDKGSHWGQAPHFLFTPCLMLGFEDELLASCSCPHDVGVLCTQKILFLCVILGSEPLSLMPASSELFTG